MQIDVIPEWQLTADDEAQIGTLLVAAFDESFGGRSYHQQRHHMRLVARDPEVVGHMALCYRDIRMGDVLVPIIGLAEVATAPERQGQGIGSRLMAAALAQARASQAAFFVLFGVRPMYAGNGFQPMSNKLISTQLYDARTGQVVTEPHDALMVLPLKGLDWDPQATIDLLGWKF